MHLMDPKYLAYCGVYKNQPLARYSKPYYPVLFISEYFFTIRLIQSSHLRLVFQTLYHAFPPNTSVPVSFLPHVSNEPTLSHVILLVILIQILFDMYKIKSSWSRSIFEIYIMFYVFEVRDASKIFFDANSCDDDGLVWSVFRIRK